MLGVVAHLDRAATVGLVDSGLHRRCDLVAIEDRFAVHMPRGTSDRLCQGSLVAQETGLVGIEDCNKGDLRQVEPFAQ